LFDGAAECTEFDWDGFDPGTVGDGGAVCDGGVESLVSRQQEVVVLVGWPGSGKSTIATKVLVPAGYVWINQDTLKTASKCLEAARTAVASGKSVVIDNTNPSSIGRSQFVSLARMRKLPCRCFHFTASRELAEHLNMYRERLSRGQRAHVPAIGYNLFNKHYQEPTLSEGFSEIKKINFVASFDNDEARRLFYQRA